MDQVNVVTNFIFFPQKLCLLILFPYILFLFTLFVLGLFLFNDFSLNTLPFCFSLVFFRFKNFPYHIFLFRQLILMIILLLILFLLIIFNSTFLYSQYIFLSIPFTNDTFSFNNLLSILFFLIILPSNTFSPVLVHSILSHSMFSLSLVFKVIFQHCLSTLPG